MPNFTLSEIPLKLSNNKDISNLYCRAVCGVCVQYCVLRPKKEKYS